MNTWHSYRHRSTAWRREQNGLEMRLVDFKFSNQPDGLPTGSWTEYTASIWTNNPKQLRRLLVSAFDALAKTSNPDPLQLKLGHSDFEFGPNGLAYSPLKG